MNRIVQCSPRLDTTFAALSDPIRRGILEHLGRTDASTWIDRYRKILEERFDRLEAFLERTKGADHEHNRSRVRPKSKNHHSRRS